MMPKGIFSATYSLFLGKEDGGYGPVIDLNVDLVHSISPFQNERPSSVNGLNSGGRLYVRTRLEGWILPCAIGSKLQEVYKVSVDPLRVDTNIYPWYECLQSCWKF